MKSDLRKSVDVGVMVVAAVCDAAAPYNGAVFISVASAAATAVMGMTAVVLSHLRSPKKPGGVL